MCRNEYEYVSACVHVCFGVAQVQRTFVAGRAVTDTLRRLLVDRGYDLSSSAGFEDVREIKERLAFIAPDFNDELSRAPTNKQLAQSFQLPTEFVHSRCAYMYTVTVAFVHLRYISGGAALQVELDVERFECSEPLFDPTRLGRDSFGAHQLVANAIETCEPSLRGTLLQNVLVTGGCAQMRGFEQRLKKELNRLFQERADVNPYVLYCTVCTLSSKCTAPRVEAALVKPITRTDVQRPARAWAELH